MHGAKVPRSQLEGGERRGSKRRHREMEKLRYGLAYRTLFRGGGAHIEVYPHQTKAVQGLVGGVGVTPGGGGI